MNSFVKPCGARAENTPIGVVEVFAGILGVTGVNLAGHAPADLRPVRADAAAEAALAQILEYLAGSRKDFDLKLDRSAMKPFQLKVLNRAIAIPYGQVMTYGQIATEFSSPAASRAVGGALGHNPMPILIPCHRVVAADGRLTGFSAAEGIRTKQWLLELEGRKVVSERLV
jgi:methylated-DNA-[protein]-cysteine S-methyltransferase